MKSSIKYDLALAGSLALGITNGVAVSNNIAEPLDHNRIGMNSAISNTIGIDVAYDPSLDTKLNPGSPNSYRRNLFTKDAILVRDKYDLHHSDWHKPDTFEENIAVKMDPFTTGGIAGIISSIALVIIVCINRKKEQENTQYSNS